MFIRIVNSPRALVAVFVVVIGGSSLIYDLAEGTSYLDSVYWALVTATTLGYGDFSPASTEGKVLTSVLICATVFLFIPMITANLASRLIVDRDAFTHEEQEEIKSSLARILERLDQTAG